MYVWSFMGRFGLSYNLRVISIRMEMKVMEFDGFVLGEYVEWEGWRVEDWVLKNINIRIWIKKIKIL